MAIVGTKGADKAAKLAKGSKIAQSARLRLTDRLPASVQKFFSKDGWRNIADYYLRGQKINWKNTLITGATSISLLGMGAFGVPKVVKFVKKIDIDCSFASQQSADSYLAAILMPKLDCDFSYDKDGGNGKSKTKANGKVLTSFDEVARYIERYGKLPDNFITKSEARKLGWDPKKGNLDQIAEGKSIGGNVFKNREGLLPDAPGRIWYEADINYKSGYRGSDRIFFQTMV